MLMRSTVQCPVLIMVLTLCFPDIQCYMVQKNGTNVSEEPSALIFRSATLMMEVAGSSITQVPIYQMTQYHTTEGCNPESEELLCTIRFRPGTVPENDDQITGAFLTNIYISYVVINVCPSVHPSPSIRDKCCTLDCHKIKIGVLCKNLFSKCE